MASTNAPIYDYDGTPTTVISLTADLADGNFAGGTTEFDNSTDKWPMARATLSLPSGCTGGAWDSNPVVHLWMAKHDIDGTSDELDPSGTDAKAAHYVGTFEIDDHATIATPQYKQISFSMDATEKCGFFISNETGRSLDYVATAITVKVEGFSYVPSA